MKKEQLLEFGIEIVSGIKASAYNETIEDGRINALLDTETDMLEDDDFKNHTPETQANITAYCEANKLRLHEQALFIADITLKKLESMGIATNLPKELTAGNGAKSLLRGAFYETYDISNPDFCSENCDDCHDDCAIDDICREEYLIQEVPVSWTTIKEIYKKIVKYYQEN